jgi:isoleucyl-tRNA synthetase
MNSSYWEKLRLVRDAVNKELENQRAAGKLGAPLEGAAYLYCDAELKTQLDKLENELRFVLITSRAEVRLANSHMSDVAATDVPGLWVKVVALEDKKCERCWHRRGDIGENPHYPTLCIRCVENIDGKGEERRYA